MNAENGTIRTRGEFRTGLQDEEETDRLNTAVLHLCTLFIL
jgi:hypothetical protein